MFLDPSEQSTRQRLDASVKQRLEERHAPTDLVNKVYRLCEPSIVGTVHAESLRRVLCHDVGLMPAEAAHIVSSAVESAGGEDDAILLKDVHAALLHHQHWDTSVTLSKDGVAVRPKADPVPWRGNDSAAALMNQGLGRSPPVEPHDRQRLRRRLLEALEAHAGPLKAWFRVPEEVHPGRALVYRTKLAYPEIHALLPRLGIREVSEGQLRALYSDHAGCEEGMTLSQWWHHTRQPVEFARADPRTGEQARPSADEVSRRPPEGDKTARAHLQLATQRNVSVQTAALLGGRVYRGLEQAADPAAAHFEVGHRGTGAEQAERWLDKTFDRGFLRKLRGTNVHWPERMRGGGTYRPPPSTVGEHMVDPPPRDRTMAPAFSPMRSRAPAEAAPWATDANFRPAPANARPVRPPPFDVGGHERNLANKRTVHERASPSVEPPFALDVPFVQALPAAYLAGLAYTQAGELMGHSPRSDQGVVQTPVAASGRGVRQ